MVKLIQINIFKGKYLDALVEFLKREKPDIVTMQEVSAMEANYFENKSLDIFEYVKNALDMYGSFCNITEFIGFPKAAVGNAVLCKFSIIKTEYKFMKKYKPITLEMYEQQKYFADFSRGLIDVTVNINGIAVHIISLHGAWTAPPTDTPEALRQAAVIADYLKKLKEPFVVGADMNTTPEKLVIKIIEEGANNWMTGSKVVSTIHPTVHKVGDKKLLVDYVFASRHFKKIRLAVPEVLISDHLPIVCKLEFNA